MTGIRGRLLAAFATVVLPPLVLMSVGASLLLSRSFERSAAARLERGLQTAVDRLEGLRRTAEAELSALAAQDLATLLAAADPETTLPVHVGRARELPAFEVVDGSGRVLASRHWPAGVGLGSSDVILAPDPAFRLVKAAQGYGFVERLAVMPGRPARWHDAPVIVRGGPFLDPDFLAQTSQLLGLELGLCDTTHGRWIVPEASPLAGWSGPGPSPSHRGEVVLGGGGYRWAGRPLADGLWLVAALPRAEVDEAVRNVRLLAALLTLAALAASLVVALLLSGRLARPIRQLATASRRVAQGDLAGHVEVAGPAEAQELARAFNEMTTELRESRDRLVQTERVAAWREMARRLAHELKNPLFPIQLSLETLRKHHWPAGSSPPRPGTAEAQFSTLFEESTQTILEELRALRGIIDEFSAFARMPRPVLRPTDVNEVVGHVLNLYRARSEGVRVEARLASGLPLLAADRDLLVRAVGNLVLNAIEAMPGGGALVLTTAPAPGGVVIQIEDSGPGLTEQERTRLFTPYYTTKRGGTGLGLAFVQGVVADHGGRVAVTSVPGQGTGFALFLPLAPAPQEPTSTESRRDAASPGSAVDS